VPSFRGVIWVVEDDEGADDVGQKGWWTAAGKAPCKDSNPSFRDISSDFKEGFGVWETYLATIPRIG
jgi:hypothetical protein